MRDYPSGFSETDNQHPPLLVPPPSGCHIQQNYEDTSPIRRGDSENARFLFLTYSETQWKRLIYQETYKERPPRFVIIGLTALDAHPSSSRSPPRTPTFFFFIPLEPRVE